MSNFERRFGKYAIKNISLLLIMCYAVGYLIEKVNPVFLLYLTLNPYAILHGQIWRLVTWIIIPPESSNLFFVLIMLYFYYSLGTSLERTWGTYRYNLYLFSGMLFTIIGCFLLMGYCYLFGLVEGEGFFEYLSLHFSTYYINMSALWPRTPARSAPATAAPTPPPRLPLPPGRAAISPLATAMTPC